MSSFFVVRTFWSWHHPYNYHYHINCRQWVLEALAEAKSRTNQRRQSAEVSRLSKSPAYSYIRRPILIRNPVMMVRLWCISYNTRSWPDTWHLPTFIGECKPIIAEYLRCLRRLKGMNDAECRMMAKDYLKCRMDQYVTFFSPGIFTLLWKEEEWGPSAFGNGLGSKKWWYRQFSSSLMAPDEFRNLGFPDEDRVEPVPNHAGGATSHKVRDDGKKITWGRYLRPSGQWISSACKGICITARSNSTNSHVQVQVHYHYLTGILIKLLFRGAEYCLLCWSLNTVPAVKGQSSRPEFNLVWIVGFGGEVDIQYSNVVVF